jgi:ethanolamine ammonia-lyase large subunit
MQRHELLTTFVLANAFKEGDLALGGTRDERVRAEARQVLAALRVRDIMATPCMDDGVSDALRRALNPTLVHDIEHLSVAAVRRLLLGNRGAQWAQHYRDGLASEVLAAVVKIMTNEDLGRVARTLYNRLCRKVGFWRPNPKIGYQKINDLQVSTFLFSVICDRA